VVKVEVLWHWERGGKLVLPVNMSESRKGMGRAVTLAEIILYRISASTFISIRQIINGAGVNNMGSTGCCEEKSRPRASAGRQEKRQFISADKRAAHVRQR